MVVLHGFPYSNYHNIVKHALMIKGVEFEERITYPGTPELLAVNPTGKVPAMTTTKGSPLAESSVLVEYLEDAYPQQPLYPTDPEEKAKVRQIMKVAELYLELSARRLLPFAMTKSAPPKELVAEVKSVLDRGTRALSALAQFKPYVCGDKLTLADVYLRYALAIAKLVGPSFLQWNVLDSVEGLSQWDKLMADNEISQKIDADQAANAEEFMAYVSGQMKK
ncbi:MAG: glutathione S-transferase family protein [Cellvibrionaceae bacterium]